MTIFGGSKCNEDTQEYQQAMEIGSRLAEAGFTICTGGYLGVMRSDSAQGIQLIKCKQCGKWVPQSNVTDGVNGPVCAGGCDA